jgi:threonine aldolase
MKEIYHHAKAHAIPVHVDGARLFNAAASSNCSIQEFTQYSDTVQICLSKGLGAPVGSILAGPEDFIKKARKWRKRLGGGLRQVGIIAAPGLVALTKMTERLVEDHKNAKYLAESLEEIEELTIPNTVDTNIVVVEVGELGCSADRFVQALKEKGVLAVTFGPTQVRLTTHYDVDKQDLTKAIEAIQSTTIELKE